MSKFCLTFIINLNSLQNSEKLSQTVSDFAKSKEMLTILITNISQ